MKRDTYYRELFDSMSEGLIHQDEDGQIAMCNHAGELILGLTTEQLKGQSFSDITRNAIHEDGSAFAPKENPVFLAIKTGQNQQNVIMGLPKPFDKISWIEVNACLVGEKSHSDGIVLTFRDVSARIEAENKIKTSPGVFSPKGSNDDLAKQMLRFKTAIDQSPSTIVITNADGEIEYANPAFEEITGYKINEVLGENPKFLKTEYHDKAFYQDMWKTISGGNVWKGEFRNRKKNGEEYWEHAVMAPVLSSDGQIVNYVAVKEDVTEKRKILLQLKETIKIKDKFLSIISHDLRAPFGAIIGLSEVMVDSIESKNFEALAKYASLINQGAKQYYDLLNDLLTWARIQTNKIALKRQDYSIKELISHVQDQLLESAKRKSIELMLDCKEDLILNVDKFMFESIIRNLISNAIKFTPEAGQIKLDCLKQEKEVRFVIIDNGVGMSDKQAKSLFSEKGVESTNGTQSEPGTGLGLVICKDFVEMHGGQIWAESSKQEGNSGTKVYFSLPVS